MKCVERVPGAGVIQIETLVVREQPIIRDVIDAAEAKRRAEMISFAGVVVNNV